MIASGKPFNPSTMAMGMSSTPRFFGSFITRSQNLAPSDVSIQRPRMSFVPSAVTPSATYTALFRTRPSSRIFTHRASKKTNGYIASSGRFCHSATVSSTASVMLEIRSGETSSP